MSLQIDLEPQSLWDQNAIEQIEEPLYEQREDRGRNCALENSGMIVQVEPAQNRFPQTAGANQCCQSRRSDIDHRAGFDAGEN
jgi:hypothetical protein